MKKYSNKVKKWVSEEEFERLHNSRDKKTCRGGKAHDYVLVLPEYISYNEGYKFNPEKYYAIMDARYDFIEKQDQELKKMGIGSRTSANYRSTRHLICSICKKKEYGDLKK